MKLSIDRKKLTSGLIITAAGILAVSTVVFAAGGGGGAPGGMGGSGNMGEVQMSESVITVKLQTPGTGSLSRETEFIGRVEPAESVSVYPEVNGKVTAVHFEAGETVNKGDLLFELDDSDAQLSYQVAQANYEQKTISADTTLGSSYDSKLLSAKSKLESAQENLNAARLNLKDYNDGVGEDVITAEKAEEKLYAQMKSLQNEIDEKKAAGEDTAALEATLTNVEAEYSLARANVNELDDSSDPTLRNYRTAYKNAQSNYDSSKADYDLLTNESLADTQAATEAELKSAGLSLEQSASSLDKYKVYAPISGVIETRGIDIYDVASANTAAFTISNKNEMTVKFNASADAAVALHTGDSVTLNKSGNAYTALITSIDSKADASTGLFPIKAQIQNDGGALLSGVTVKVSATTQKAEDVLLVPLDIVYYDEGQAYVFTYADGKAHRADFETGMSNAETVVAETGLTQDSQMITTWHPDLKDGASVVLAEGQG